MAALIVEFNGTKYAYVHNLQGDIVAILDSNGTAVVTYKYDAWGKPISKTGSMASTLGTVQPFRYRGYVYDEETGLYYLRSRYYTVQWLRFINCDSIICRNMFSYCANTPIIAQDHAGTETTMLSFAKMGFGNLLSAILCDGTCGAAISDTISPPKARGLDQEAVDAFCGELSEEIFGFSSIGGMVNELCKKGGLAFSASLIVGGSRLGGFWGGVAAGGLSIVIMICATGMGSTAEEKIDGATAYDEESISEDILSGIADIPLEKIEINTGHPFSDRVVDRLIDKVKTLIVETLVK